MAEDTQTPVAPPTVDSELPPPPASEDDQKPPPKKNALEYALAAEAAAEAEAQSAAAEAATVAKAEAEAETEAEKEAKVEAEVEKLQAPSFKEESNVVSELVDPERKALDELKELVKVALANHQFSPPPPKPQAEAPVVEEAKVDKKDEVTKEDEKTVETVAETVVSAAAAVPVSSEVKSEVADENKDEKTVEAVGETVVPVAEAAEPPVVEIPVIQAPSEVKDEIKDEKTVEAIKETVAPAVEAPKPSEVEIPAIKAPSEVTDDIKDEKTVEAVKETVAAASETLVTEVPSEVTAENKEDKTVEAIKEAVVAAASGTVEVETPVAEATAENKEEKTEIEPEEVVIWGVPLLGDERSDTVLLKFLRARDFKVKEAFAMLKNAVLWRKQFGIEALVEEDLGLHELDKVVFMHGVDKDGHPVCYNVYGELQDKELYSLVFADEEKKQKFLRWRIQFLEKGIRSLLDFNPGGVSTMVQVIDLKNTSLIAKKELRQALALLQDNYPEFAAKQIFINVPWWYLAYNRMISPFFTQRTKSKFVFAGPSKSAETLFKYIAPEQVPVQYGGMYKSDDMEFSSNDAVTEITIKPSVKQAVEIPVSENSLLVWELRVLGWDVTYGAEFVPTAEDSYTIIVQKERKMTATDEPLVKNSFKSGEAGKVVLTIDNTSSKRKKLLYRYKIKNSEVQN